MKVRVWAKNYGAAVKGKLIWVGEMDDIPTNDDYLVIHDERDAEPIKNIFYNLYDGSVTIEIAPDYNDEYPEVEDE